MFKLSSLCDSLYQEFFTGKGTLSLDLEVVDQKISGHCSEEWELYDKKGKLTLKTDSYLALVYALSFLGNLPPQQALSYLGKQSPRFKVRALYLDEKVVLTEESIATILKLGYNTLVGDYRPSQPIEGLKFLPILRSKADAVASRNDTLQDLVVKELLEGEKKYPQMIYFTEERLGFEELNYRAKTSFLSYRGQSISELLDQSEPFGTPLLPSIKACWGEGKFPLFERKSRGYEQQDSSKHPIEGWLIEAPRLPEKNSYLAGNLFALGYCQFVGKDSYSLYQSWFKTHYPNQFNEEAHHLLETIAHSSKVTETKASKQKLLAELACLQEKWPQSIYTQASLAFEVK